MPVEQAYEDYRALAAQGRLVPALRAGQGIERWNDEQEFEIKLRPEVNDTGCIVELLDRAWPHVVSGPYLLDRARAQDELTPEYFMNDTDELSLFEYEGRRMLKIKRHAVLGGYTYPVMRSRETFCYGGDIEAELNRTEPTAHGSLTKYRAKNFVFDTEKRRVYSLAVTVCERGDRARQVQVELEYFGHLAGTNAELDESSCVHGLVELAQVLVEGADISLVPTTDTKFEFLTRRTGH